MENALLDNDGRNSWAGGKPTGPGERPSCLGPSYSGPALSIALTALFLANLCAPELLCVCVRECRSQLVRNEGLKISGVQSSDEGTYVCHAENAVGSREAHAKLTVLSTLLYHSIIIIIIIIINIIFPILIS